MAERRGTEGPRSRLRWLAHVLAAVNAALVVAVLIIAPSEGDVLDLVGFLIFLGAMIAVGWFVAWRRTSLPLGWLMLVIPILFLLEGPTGALGASLLDTSPGAAQWLLFYGGQSDSTWIWLPPIFIMLTQLPLYFPNGQLPSPRWRWFGVYTVVAGSLATLILMIDPAEVYPGVANPVHIEWPAEIADILRIIAFVPLLAFSLVGSLVSLFVRYRRAGVTERAQLRWVFWALGLVIIALLTTWVVSAAGNDVNLSVFGAAVYTLIPISIGFSVLRYRLFDIDRIVSRTTSYAISLLAAVGVYAAIVIGVTQLLPGLQGVGIAVATLAAAAVFFPLLRVVRRRIDRLFNREQYDAERVVEAFGRRLRDGADPHTAAADLEAAIEQTLQPRAIGIWVPRR